MNGTTTGLDGTTTGLDGATTGLDGTMPTLGDSITGTYDTMVVDELMVNYK